MEPFTAYASIEYNKTTTPPVTNTGNTKVAEI